jgi:ribosome maturation factor RimP
MDTILVVNAGSSSLKFQAFEVSAPEQLTCVVKGQLDGIGTRPRLRAGKSDGQHLIDQNYDATQVKDLPAAIGTAGDWLRTLPGLNLVAVGHRVVHGGPEFDQPILLNADVVSQLERYVPLAPLHQPNNLAPIRSLLASRPGLPQVEAESIAREIAGEMGLEIVEFVFHDRGRHSQLRIDVDRPGASGVSLADCERFSRSLDARMESIEGLDSGYELQVSSPGIDRPIRSDDDIRRNTGRTVRLEFRHRFPLRASPHVPVTIVARPDDVLRGY